MGDLHDLALRRIRLAAAQIAHEQPGFRQPLEYRVRAVGQLAPERDPPAPLAASLVDLGEPRDERLTEQPLAIDGIARDERCSLRLGHRRFDRGHQRAGDAAELVVLLQCQLAVGAVFGVETLERERQHRQRVRTLGIGKQLLGQLRLDLQLTAVVATERPSRRLLDDVAVLAAIHRCQIDHLPADMTQQLIVLQVTVQVGTDGHEHENPRPARGRARLAEPVPDGCQLRAQLSRLPRGAVLARVEFLGLIDRQDERRFGHLPDGAGHDPFVQSLEVLREGLAVWIVAKPRPHVADVRRRDADGAESCHDGRGEALRPVDRGATRPNDGKRVEVMIVASQPGPQAGTHER